MIINRLYQGGVPPFGRILAESGINVLVLAANENADPLKYTGLKIICVPGDDDLRPHRLDLYIDEWKRAAWEVAQHVRADENVLVTCMAGHNRSGIISAIALHHLTGKSGSWCVEQVIKKRQHALNNQTFAQYVIDNYEENDSIHKR